MPVDQSTHVTTHPGWWGCAWELETRLPAGEGNSSILKAMPNVRKIM